MVARRDRGYDAGKKINGTKRHLAVDTGGLLLTVLFTAASIQDRDAARPLLWNLRQTFPQIRLAWADGGYAGKLVTWAKTAISLTLESVRRPDDLRTFEVVPADGWLSGLWRGSPGTGGPSVTTNGWRSTTKPVSTGP